ncbi:MAG: putative metal-binding motif-containing protein, partial [Myxococcales bacterium]|nr:putative metal-binding motif-containing protein [Myxococcales bacterium]
NDTWGGAVAGVQCAPIAGAVLQGGDCNDASSTFHPGAPETCSGFDEDCDGLVDDADPDMTGGSNVYADSDHDGFGDVNAAILRCAPPAGYVVDATDCDDTDPAIHPGAPEICNANVDDDCDGLADTADSSVVGALFLFADVDGDGWGDGPATRSCTPIAGRVTTFGDCDDNDRNVSPSAPELCNGLDEDCDGLTDDVDPDAQPRDWFQDLDSDGYG